MNDHRDPSLGRSAGGLEAMDEETAAALEHADEQLKQRTHQLPASSTMPFKPAYPNPGRVTQRPRGRDVTDRKSAAVCEMRGASAAGPYIPLINRGGLILTAPKLVSLYWGPFTNPEIVSMQTWLTGFASFLSGTGAPSRTEPAVRQYGVASATIDASFNDPTLPGATVGWPEIGAKIAALQQAGSLPASGSQRLFFVFTKNITIGGYPNIWLGLHGGSPGIPIAICPFPGDSALSQWQWVTSHEIMEARDRSRRHGMESKQWSGGWRSLPSAGCQYAIWHPARIRRQPPTAVLRMEQSDGLGRRRILRR